MPMKNRDPVDGYTAAHVAAGVGFALAGVKFKTAMLLAVGYEVFEQLLERSETGQRLFKTNGPESAVNVATDLAVFAAGFVATEKLR